MGEVIAGFVYTSTIESGYVAREEVREIGKAFAGTVADILFIRVAVIDKDISIRVYAWRKRGLFPSEHPIPPKGPDGGGGNHYRKI